MLILKKIIHYKEIILYSLLMAALIFLVKWLEIRLIVISHLYELYMSCIAILFTGLGIWLALKLAKPKIKTVVVEKEVTVFVKEGFVASETEIEKQGLSKRELEVLELMSRGLSNQEIAGKLFVSLNTIKTHSSKVYEKLDVKRRTQAVEKAKRLGLIP